jgi:hypothetical protein
MENIGVMTHQRIVPYIVVKNLMGASTVILWRKLEQWVYALREETGSSQAFEWFQWLAERLEDLGAGDEEPAFVSQKSWRPARLTEEI